MGPSQVDANSNNRYATTMGKRPPTIDKDKDTDKRDNNTTIMMKMTRMRLA